MSEEAKRQAGSGEQKAPEPTPRERERQALSEAERIRSLRDRLYARGATPATLSRKPLESREKLAPSRTPDSRVVASPTRVETEVRPRDVAAPSSHPQSTSPTTDTTMAIKRSRRSYRIKLALAGVVFFVGALILSSAFLFMGNNTISGSNIGIGVTGSQTAGGGEVYEYQIVIQNENTLPMESATLIINYPRGTQSADEPGKEKYADRIPLERIDSGELVKVDQRAVFFGEENEEKVVRVSVEYRVRGSNATFSKEAEPLRFLIGSSPVVLRADTVQSISSGQELTIELEVESNSPAQLSDMLVKASYPYGFEFVESKPEPVSGQDTWSIPVLKSEEKRTITIKGIVTGREDESRRFTFSAGVPNERDRFALASALTSTAVDVSIEQPFLGVTIEVNGESDNPVVIKKRESASVTVKFTNTLSTTLYDGVLKAELSGNALRETDIRVNGGYYDSTTNTVIWDSVDTPALKEIAPGVSQSVSFSLRPDANVPRTPEISVSITAEGKRVFEDRVSQQLVGTVSKTIKIEGSPVFTSAALYSDGPFVNSGPVPPKAEQVTQYTYLLAVQNDTNELTGGSVTAVIPAYMQWLDLYTEDDDVSYDPTTRTMRWNIGNIGANTRKEVWVQVSFLPSLSQVGTTPTILEEQRFRATDRFTGTTVGAMAPALSTQLINDPALSRVSGKVTE